MGLPDTWRERRARRADARRVWGEEPLRVPSIRDQARQNPFGGPKGLCGAQCRESTPEQSRMEGGA